jgi:hypothetical protein
MILTALIAPVFLFEHFRTSPNAPVIYVIKENKKIPVPRAVPME